MNRTTLNTREAAIRLLPLSITLAATAVILQNASALRMARIPDDALLPPLLDYIQPAAAAVIIAGYLLSAVILILPGLPRWSRARRRPCRHEDHPDCTASPDTGNSSASC